VSEAERDAAWTEERSDEGRRRLGRGAERTGSPVSEAERTGSPVTGATRRRVIVEADGGSRGNPGPAGYGAVVVDATTGEMLAERNGAIGVTTNNVAEYQGLIAGLQAAADVGAAEVEVRMDSRLVVEQMTGRWQIKHPVLRPLAAKAAQLASRFARTSYVWVPRERNRRADALANAAMDGRPVAGRAPGPAAPAGSGGSSWEPRVGAPLRVLLIRHGETELTAQRRYSGRGDVPLTERGRAQGQAVAARVMALGAPLTAVVTSPLERCTRTAEQFVGTPVVIDPDLTECDFGAWEGHTFADVRERWRAELAAWLESTAVAPPGGESFDAVGERAARALARLRATYAEGVVAVISHVTPLKLILRDALAATDVFLYRCYLDPAGLSIVDFWPDGGIAVRTVNDTAHLR
jgi:broad specificity phosphatase PhoE/ribonuclease HI